MFSIFYKTYKQLLANNKTARKKNRRKKHYILNKIKQSFHGKIERTHKSNWYFHGKLERPIYI